MATKELSEKNRIAGQKILAMRAANAARAEAKEKVLAARGPVKPKFEAPEVRGAGVEPIRAGDDPGVGRAPPQEAELRSGTSLRSPSYAVAERINAALEPTPRNGPVKRMGELAPEVLESIGPVNPPQKSGFTEEEGIVRLTGVRRIHSTEKGLLVSYRGKKDWIGRGQALEGSTISRDGSVGTLVLYYGHAVRLHFVDEAECRIEAQTTLVAAGVSPETAKHPALYGGILRRAAAQVLNPDAARAYQGWSSLGSVRPERIVVVEDALDAVAYQEVHREERVGYVCVGHDPNPKALEWARGHLAQLLERGVRKGKMPMVTLGLGKSPEAAAWKRMVGEFLEGRAEVGMDIPRGTSWGVLIKGREAERGR